MRAKIPFLIALTFLFLSRTASAQVVLSEIMYDLSGTDTGREWVEIANTSASSVIIATSTWKFFEGSTNHGLTLFQGSASITVGGFAIIVDNPQKFLADWPSFSGTIFDSTFSLGNTSETVALKSSTTTIVDQVTYNSSMGGNGDGNSLQLVSGTWKPLTPTPGLANSLAGVSTSGSSSEASNSGTSTSTDQSGSNTASSEPVPDPNIGKTNWPVEPQVFSRISGPATAIAGADVLFKGEAVGKDKEPLANARYVWNFGDGASKEGESVMHAYNFPGDYVVILDVSSGKFSGTSRVKIMVVPASIAIGTVSEGMDGKIELVNDSGQELDLSWWRIKSGEAFFTLPKNTKLLPHARLPLSATVMGFAIDSRTSLHYPNGAVAYQFEGKKPETLAKVTTAPIAAASSEEAAAEPVSSLAVAPKSKPVSIEVAQTAAVADSALEERSGENESPSPAPRSSPLWLYGVAGVIILGLGFTLLPKPVSPEPAPKSLADDIEILE